VGRSVKVHRTQTQKMQVTSCLLKQERLEGSFTGNSLVTSFRILVYILVELKPACLLPLLCCAAVSLSKTPQQQPWDILQAGVSDKSAARRTRAMRALGLLTGNQKAVDAAQSALVQPF
jgi:hypothetical protein